MAEQEIKVKLTVDDQMSSGIEDASKKTKKSIDDTKDSFSGLSKEIGTNFTNAIKGAVLGYVGLQGIQKVTQFMKESRAEFQDSVRAQLQLRTALGYTSVALNQQADALADKLKVDNDEITKVQALISNYVKNDEAVRKLTPAILDLAAATGMDMASAANIVAKAVNDDSGELGKFKISVDGARGSSERITSVVQGLTEKFKGQAEAIASSKDGFDKMSLAWKDFQEKVGGSDFMRMWSEGAAELVSKWTEGAKIILGQTKNTADSEKQIAKNASDRKIAILKQESELKEQIRKDNLEKYKKIKEDEKQSFITGYTMQEESRIALTRDGIKKEFALLNLKYQMDLEKFKDNKIMTAAIEQQYGNQARALTIADNKRTDAQIYDAKIQNQLMEMEGKKQLNELDIATRREMELEALKQQNADAEEYANLRKQQISDGIQGAGQLFSVIAGANKRNAQEKKNIASVEAGINTAVAITKALPNPFAVAMAAAIGLAQQVAIRNAKFATGTAYAPGGMALVGESGPEYVNLPKGAQVYNNSQTRNMTTNASMSVTIMDASGNITETIRAQLRSGAGDQLVRDISNRMNRQL